MMIKTVLPILCLASLAASVGDQIRHLMIDESNLIETSQGFAINAANLAQNNIKTISTNGDRFVFTAPNCQEAVLTRQQISNMPNYESLLTSAKMELNSLEQQPSFNNAQRRSGVARFTLNDQMMSSSFQGRNMQSQSFNSNGMQLIKYDENSMWMRRPNMPNNINRIFISNDIVSFVYNDGQIKMKPVACLQPIEQQLIKQVRIEIQQAEAQFRQSMRLFNHNMQQMQQQMQQQMGVNFQNMQMGMQNGLGGYGRNYNQFNGRRGAQLQGFGGAAPMGQSQMQGTGFPQAAAGTYQSMTPSLIPQTPINFGNNFPFGPNNSPFYEGFPF